MQRKAQQMGGSLNDLLMTVLSLSFKQYLVKYTKDNTTDMISLAVPFSLRRRPKHRMDFSFDN